MRKKKDLFLKQPRYIKQVQGLRQCRFTNKIIAVKQNDRLQQLHIYKNYSFNANLLFVTIVLCNKINIKSITPLVKLNSQETFV